MTIKWPDAGFTPKNYEALVKSTGLSNSEFYHTFNILPQTFRQHLNGKRTMSWQDWQILVQKVKNYSNQDEVLGTFKAVLQDGSRDHDLRSKSLVDAYHESLKKFGDEVVGIEFLIAESLEALIAGKPNQSRNFKPEHERYYHFDITIDDEVVSISSPNFKTPLQFKAKSNITFQSQMIPTSFIHQLTVIDDSE